jgi:ankyrin repeat protein
MEGTTIQMAAGDGLLDVVKSFIANGTDVNAKDDAGYTAMHAAVSYGHVDMLRYLLSVGGDVNVADEDGEYSTRGLAQAPLRGSARRRRGDARTRGSHSRVPPPPRAALPTTPRAGDTPLHVCETVECAQALLDAGATLAAADAEGKTPYHIADFDEDGDDSDDGEGEQQQQ